MLTAKEQASVREFAEALQVAVLVLRGDTVQDADTRRRLSQALCRATTALRQFQQHPDADAPRQPRARMRVLP